jgi:hypothetical protein
MIQKRKAELWFDFKHPGITFISVTEGDSEDVYLLQDVAGGLMKIEQIGEGISKEVSDMLIFQELSILRLNKFFEDRENGR